MKKSKLIKRNQIMVLYQYFLLNENENLFSEFLKLNETTKMSIDNVIEENEDGRSWFDDFRQKRSNIFPLISSNLKSGWKLERIPVFERAVIVSATYAMFKQNATEKKKLSFLINQTINFSKRYFVKEKCDYINKVLDLTADVLMSKQKIVVENKEVEILKA